VRAIFTSIASKQRTAVATRGVAQLPPPLPTPSVETVRVVTASDLIVAGLQHSTPIRDSRQMRPLLSHLQQRRFKISE
jgi:hypothetical protein